MKTFQEASISDHKPKVLYSRLFHKKYTNRETKKPKKIRWERLKNDITAKDFKMRVEEYLDDLEEDKEDTAMTTTNWNKISNTLNNAAAEVCGVSEKKIENPWLEDKDEEIRILRDDITRAVNNKTDLLERKKEEMIGLFAMEYIEELEETVKKLKVARKTLKCTFNLS